jgi:antibiotic biosynthesis monooxygenase (ABM) superfamily enzyme
MFLITTLAVYASSVLFVKMLEIINLGWNFYFENILTSALVVGSLTWVVMPWFSRHVFRKWLYK